MSNHKFNSVADMPRTLQCKYDIISNFIEHWTSDEEERVQMYLSLGEYINDDQPNEVQCYFADLDLLHKH
jgi:hypothetical protein